MPQAQAAAPTEATTAACRRRSPPTSTGRHPGRSPSPRSKSPSSVVFRMTARRDASARRPYPEEQLRMWSQPYAVQSHGVISVAPKSATRRRDRPHRGSYADRCMPRDPFDEVTLHDFECEEEDGGIGSTA